MKVSILARSREVLRKVVAVKFVDLDFDIARKIFVVKLNHKNHRSFEMFIPFALDKIFICRKPLHDSVQVFGRNAAVVMLKTRFVLKPDFGGVGGRFSLARMHVNRFVVFVRPKENQIAEQSTHLRQICQLPRGQYPKSKRHLFVRNPKVAQFPLC